MEKIINILFESEELALRAVNRLNQLYKNEEIYIFEQYVLIKNKHGKIQVRKIKGNTFPFFIKGAFTGSVIGIFWGIPGILAGLTCGGLLGFIVDFYYKTKYSKQIKEFTENIPKEKSAIIAHIFEYTEKPLNEALKQFNADVSRIYKETDPEGYLRVKRHELERQIEKMKQKEKIAGKKEKAMLLDGLNELERRKQVLNKYEKDFKSKQRTPVIQRIKDWENWREYKKEEALKEFNDWKGEYNQKITDIKSGVLSHFKDRKSENIEQVLTYVNDNLEKLDKEIESFQSRMDSIPDDLKKETKIKIEDLKIRRIEMLIEANELIFERVRK